MIPIGDENPTLRRPWVTWAIIGLNGLVFLLLNVVRGEDFFSLSRGDLDAWGLPTVHPAPGRFLSSMFVHAGPLHLLGNMWFLHIFGDNVEDKLGRVKYLLLYVGWGIAASLAFAWFGKQSFIDPRMSPGEVEAGWHQVKLVGASGSISGVMGAYLVLFPRARIRMVFWILFIFTFSMPAVLVIGLYFLQNLVLGMQTGGSGVAFAAHTGGMIAGVLTALVMKPFLRGGTPSSWDRDTGFAPAGAAGPVVFDARRPEPSRTFPMPDLRDQLVGAVLDGRWDLALDLYANWVSAPRMEVLPPQVEIEVAHEIFRRGRIPEALEAYRRFLGSHPRAPDAPEAKFRVGLIHGKAEGDRVEALRWLRQAAEEHPDPETAAFARREIRRLGG